MKIIILLVLVAVVVVVGQECGQAGITAADDCAYKAAFLMNRNIAVPKTMDEVKAHCG